jgi:hypothetical protein
MTDRTRGNSLSFQIGPDWSKRIAWKGGVLFNETTTDIYFFNYCKSRIFNFLAVEEKRYRDIYIRLTL